VLAAGDVGALATVLGAALFERFAWRGEADFGDCLLSANAQAVRRPREITAAAS